MLNVANIGSIKETEVAVTMTSRIEALSLAFWSSPSWCFWSSKRPNLDKRVEQHRLVPLHMLSYKLMRLPASLVSMEDT